MSSSVLGDEIAQVCSETHVCYSRFVFAPFLDWETFEEDEALSVQDLCTNGT
jgi:hypothetical protein